MSKEQTNVLINENKKKLKESKFHTVFYIICVVFFPLTGLINFGIWTLTIVKYIALGLGF